ncbi:diacylglycerol kinase [Paraburkholderia caballeronis]|uniref:diacylglycerol kinase n=1 Tax=Paraburkholderia caballeronis TaxID=416943 RepID=UPI001064911C|nr:diacylglycerol kinase [Paraburkholderia caballeronis]TDV11425.1 diacylglycerol kinase (ATP) [Paraburkholderia caballeronis]TDV14615.1 diacylglycerol kinase (ATP) [Paraburkholderia caballeronis]TDV23686.1 diacylglycerol kinase (ATP) [Paraburkholderia caballeronis]
MDRPTDSTPRRPPRKKRDGALRGLYALRHSYDGFVATLHNESAFRQELVAAVVLIPCAVLVPLGAVERVMLVASVLLVLLVELINSSIEAAIDRISLERHELSGRAKDCGSAAVTVAVLICAITWIALCGPLAVRWIRTLL